MRVGWDLKRLITYQKIFSSTITKKNFLASSLSFYIYYIPSLWVFYFHGFFKKIKNHFLKRWPFCLHLFVCIYLTNSTKYYFVFLKNQCDINPFKNYWSKLKNPTDYNNNIIMLIFISTRYVSLLDIINAIQTKYSLLLLYPFMMIGNQEVAIKNGLT